jgi:Na+/H+-dicarboxylate symporter
MVSGMNPLQFLRAVSQPMITALFTSSSAATLPLSMSTAQTKLGVDSARSAFVLPLGATANMDGTALFEGIAAVFLAYMFGIELGTTGIVAIFLVAMLSSVGAPGIPSGSMAGMQMVLLAVGIPLEAIGLLLLIERPLDTFRTAVNVEGDLVGCLVAKRFTT